jgi:hypothetical protein
LKARKPDNIEMLKKYIYIILVMAAVIITVILRNIGTSHFRYDAKRWAEPSIKGSNIITPAKISSLNGEVLMVCAGKDQKPAIDARIKIIEVSPDSIMEKRYTSAIRSNNGPVLLYAMDYSVSAKIWMILSQAGFRNIYIYTIDSDQEVLKKEFRPDSITRPE